MIDRDSDHVFGLVEAPENEKTIEILESAGGSVMRIPAVKMRRIENRAGLKEVAQNLAAFDLVFFADSSSANFFFEILRECVIDPFELDQLIVCAAGEAVAERLRLEQVHSDLILASRNGDISCETIRTYIADNDELRKMKILFLTGTRLASDVAKALRSEVGKVVELDICCAETLPEGDRTKSIALLKGGAVDELVLCSAEDVESLLHLVFPDLPSAILKEIIISATDPIAFQTLREYGFFPKLKKI